MQDDKAWDRIVDAIEAKFGLERHGRTKRAVEDAPELTEHVSFIIFKRAGEDFKIERVQGPAIVDRKIMGARRAGATTHTQNVYDPNEVGFKTLMYQKVGEDWEEISAENLSL